MFVKISAKDLRVIFTKFAHDRNYYICLAFGSIVLKAAKNNLQVIDSEFVEKFSYGLLDDHCALTMYDYSLRNAAVDVFQQELFSILDQFCLTKSDYYQAKSTVSRYTLFDEVEEKFFCKTVNGEFEAPAVSHNHMGLRVWLIDRLCDYYGDKQIFVFNVSE